MVASSSVSPVLTPTSSVSRLPSQTHGTPMCSRKVPSGCTLEGSLFAWSQPGMTQIMSGFVASHALWCERCVRYTCCSSKAETDSRSVPRHLFLFFVCFSSWQRCSKLSSRGSQQYGSRRASPTVAFACCFLLQVDAQPKPAGFLDDVVEKLVATDVFTPSGLVNVDGSQIPGLSIGKRGFVSTAAAKASKEFAIAQ